MVSMHLFLRNISVSVQITSSYIFACFPILFSYSAEKDGEEIDLCIRNELEQLKLQGLGNFSKEKARGNKCTQFRCAR